MELLACKLCVGQVPKQIIIYILLSDSYLICQIDIIHSITCISLHICFTATRLLLFATTRSIVTSVKVPVVEVAKRTNC